MIKISVMYPFVEGARFDHQYYRTTHMPLVKNKLGRGCGHYLVDKGIAGGAPDSAPAYIAMCHIFPDSGEAFEAGMAEHGSAIFADVPNFTDLQPIIQVSEIVI